VLNKEPLRRLGFSPGDEVRLNDGQDWTLPGPPCPSCSGEEYEALLDAIREAGDESELLRAELALVIYLLDCNYHLTPESYEILLDGPAKGPSLLPMQQAFRGVAMAHVEQRQSQRKACPADCGRSPSRRSPFGFYRRGSSGAAGAQGAMGP
jgi:hypothetical protein